MIAALYGQKNIITRKNITIDLYVDIINRHNVSVVMCRPNIGVELLCATNIRPMPSVRELIVGSTTFSAKLLEDLKPLFPNAYITPVFGCTEGGVIFAIPEGKVKCRSTGLPFRNVQVKVMFVNFLEIFLNLKFNRLLSKILDENGNALGPNQPGEICFKLPVPFSAYYSNPEAYELAFTPDGFVKSGDIGYFESDGHFYILDRIKHMIKVKEMAFAPLDVEEAINSINGVLESRLVGVLDVNLFYEIIYAFVIKDDSKTDITEEFVMKVVAEKVIEEKKITGGVIFVNEFPKNVSGKILYRELKKMAEQIYRKK